MKKIFLLFLFLAGNIIGSEVDDTFDCRLLSLNINEVQNAIKEGANVNAINKNGSGNTALIVAALGNRLGIAKLLIDSGADVNVKNNFDQTALMLAAANNNRLEMSKLLIGAKADVNAIDNYGKTALVYAIVNDRLEIAKLLIDSGASLYVINNDASTALMSAVFHNRLEMAKVLIDSGADLDAVNNNGRTALMIAMDRKNEEMIKLIKERMECMEYLEKAKKEVSGYFSDPERQILPPVVSSIINEYL